MKGSSLKYLTREGFRSIWVNKLMSLASIAVLMACLVIIGLGSMIFFNITAYLDDLEDQNVIKVYAENDATDVEVSDIRIQIMLVDNVKDCVFIPKEDGFQKQLDKMGEDGKIIKESFEGDIPLPDGFDVVVENMELYDETFSQLEKIEGVQRVRGSIDLTQKLLNVEKAVTIISLGLVSLLFIVSLFIISNTIRITMFSRKLEISIMKAVGATNWFIRWPFMIEGINLGIISSVVSFGVLAGLYAGIQYICRGLIDSLEPVKFGEYAWPILGIFFAIGIFTGTIGSLISMQKYLKEQGGVINEE